VLAAVHFFIQSKLNIYEPVLMAGFLMWLLAYRALSRRNGEVTAVHLVLLAGLAAAAVSFWRQKPARQRASARRISPSAVSGVARLQSGS
jgi:hypothetical protein